MPQVHSNLLKMGLQIEVSGAHLCRIADSLKDKKLSDYKARQKSDILLQKLDYLAQGKKSSSFTHVHTVKSACLSKSICPIV